jgi:hypothetical protein
VLHWIPLFSFIFYYYSIIVPISISDIIESVSIDNKVPELRELWILFLRYECLTCGRIVSARLPHLHWNTKLGYCENLDPKHYANFSDAPSVDEKSFNVRIKSTSKLVSEVDHKQ